MADSFHIVVLSDGSTYDLLTNCKVFEVPGDVGMHEMEEWIAAHSDAGVPLRPTCGDGPEDWADIDLMYGDVLLPHTKE